ncbi:hypothetical protein [Subtercola boreus]|uniref:hypothetical protein n=1 Tax=Subtercola boreus TaxID=120213 RepID=UPI0011674A15|nr:hypothetical protein [Subtercola boreus]TQL55373.1 hypothetical protein FB464_2937 [Subtercola boreus]
MYVSLWRVLPGPVWLRILILVVALAIILFALSTWVFPFVDGLLTPSQPVTVNP